MSLPVSASASGPLDEIQDYIIKVDMRSDGTMDINYHIEWKVLDSTSEGPLEWVKIGIPNKHVDEIQGKGNNIKSIKYINDGGSYVRIDFDRKYEKNEIVKFDFSIHQSYMYILEDDKHICRYSFTPGWFDDIDVKHMKIMWSNINVLDSTASIEDDGFLIWEKDNMSAGARMNASVKYNMDVFSTNPDQQFVDEVKADRNHNDSINYKKAIIVIIVIIVIVVGIVWLCVKFGGDDYHGGWGGGSSTYIHTHSSCVHSSCACVSHCACACACAGGGRAGCSIKDTYTGGEGRDGKGDVDRLLDVLSKD